MSQPKKAASLLELFPEETREAAALLKKAVPLMMSHDIPPNPVHYALWYSYSKGLDAELNRRLDKTVSDFDCFPPETATKLFRDYIIHDELEMARAGQQQVIDLVDDIEGNVSRSLLGSRNYQSSLEHGLAALQEPIIDDLPNVLNELQQSTQLMQDQQEKFLYRLRAAQQGRAQRGQADAARDHDHIRRVEPHALGRTKDGALVLLAWQVAGEFQRSEPEREVDWHIQDGLQAMADPGLMRVVLHNLLGNAWKYTGQVAEAQIALTHRVDAQGTVRCCVRDNGAGFDMVYASQLFEPFKRLHAHHEFEGSGVGLATVHRVIERHGGRVRGEGAVGRGAAFFFSFPKT